MKWLMGTKKKGPTMGIRVQRKYPKKFCTLIGPYRVPIRNVGGSLLGYKQSIEGYQPRAHTKDIRLSAQPCPVDSRIFVAVAAERDLFRQGIRRQPFDNGCNSYVAGSLSRITKDTGTDTGESQ
jgi:hypothetical protein